MRKHIKPIVIAAIISLLTLTSCAADDNETQKGKLSVISQNAEKAHPAYNPTVIMIDRVLYSASEAAEQIKNGNFLNVYDIIHNKKLNEVTLEILNSFYASAVEHETVKWVKTDLEQHGLSGLLWLEKQEGDWPNRIFAIFAFVGDRIKLPFLNVGGQMTSEYLWSNNGNIFHTLSSYGTHSFRAYTHFIFSDDLHLKPVSTISVTRTYDWAIEELQNSEYIDFEEFLTEHPNWAKPGIYFRRFKECHTGIKAITAQQFLEAFEELTGRAFYDYYSVRPDWLIADVMQLKDWNFDGHLDIALVTRFGYGFRGLPSQQIFLWDSSLEMYVENEELSWLVSYSELTVDKENEMLRAVWVWGSELSHVLYLKYIEDVLTDVKRLIYEYYTWQDGFDIWRVTEENLITGDVCIRYKQLPHCGDIDINASEPTEDELVEFILRAEQVYRSIVHGRFFDHHWDEESDEWILNEHIERSPDLWVEHEWAYRGGFYMLRYRVLPSSGYTSIADLNAALHEYWSEDFEVRSGNPMVYFADFMEIDGALYYFPPEACGGWATRFIFETAQFEILEQTDERTTVRAELYITAVGTLYRGALQWEILGGRIVAKNIDWGYVVE